MKYSLSILITGASSGLGAELARQYADAGVKLFLVGRNRQRLEDVAGQCRKKGAQVHAKYIDVKDADALTGWITSIDQEAPLDLVIANAGISAGTAGGGESMAQVRHIFATNIDGVINTIGPVIPRMQARRSGQIVIISSLAAYRGLPSSPAYSASKAAVKTYGEALRGSLCRDGVKVTVVTPGYIRTPMTDVNGFPMPFKLSVEKAAHIIRTKLEKNPARIAFPFALYALIWFCGLLPPGLTDPIFSRLPGKPNAATQKKGIS